MAKKYTFVIEMELNNEVPGDPRRAGEGICRLVREAWGNETVTLLEVHDRPWDDPGDCKECGHPQVQHRSDVWGVGCYEPRTGAACECPGYTRSRARSRPSRNRKCRSERVIAITGPVNVCLGVK